MESTAVKSFSCKLCRKSYRLNYQLRSHVREKHPTADIDEVAPPCFKKADKFPCKECGKKFNYVRYLRQHERQAHPTISQELLRYWICPLCCDHCPKKEFAKHLLSVHDVTIESENLSFSSFSDFEVWKSEFEKRSNAQFKKHSDYNVEKESKVVAYVCNRSGYFKTKSKGIRNLKKQGSRKIGAHCPAEIRITMNADGNCSVHLTKTHVGHANELEHVDLAPSVKKLVAAKIVSGIPTRCILNDIRGSIENCELERKHLITRQDVDNIKASSNLLSYAHQHEEDVSVEANETDTSMGAYEIVTSVEANESDTSVEVNETDASVKRLSNKISPSTSPLLDKLKEKLIQDITEIIRNIKTIAELDAVKKITATIGPTLNAMRNSTKVKNIPKTNFNSVPFKKKIKEQRQSNATKKANKRQRLSVAKSSQEESEAAAAALLLFEPK